MAYCKRKVQFLKDEIQKVVQVLILCARVSSASVALPGSPSAEIPVLPQELKHKQQIVAKISTVMQQKAQAAQQ